MEISIEAIPGAAAVARSIKHTASLPMWATNPSSVSSSMLLLRVTPCSLCTKPDARSRSCHKDYARNSVIAFVRRGDRLPTRLLRGFEDARTWTSRLLPGVIFVLAHVYNADGDRRFSGGVNTIALVRLSPDFLPSGPARPLRFAHARRREKNWVPFAEEAGLTGHASSVALLVTYSPSSLLKAALLEGLSSLEAPQLGRPAFSGRSAGCSVALRPEEEERRALAVQSVARGAGATVSLCQSRSFGSVQYPGSSHTLFSAALCTMGGAKWHTTRVPPACGADGCRTGWGGSYSTGTRSNCRSYMPAARALPSAPPATALQVQSLRRWCALATGTTPLGSTSASSTKCSPCRRTASSRSPIPSGSVATSMTTATTFSSLRGRLWTRRPRGCASPSESRIALLPKRPCD